DKGDADNRTDAAPPEETTKPSLLPEAIVGQPPPSAVPPPLPVAAVNTRPPPTPSAVPPPAPSAVPPPAPSAVPPPAPTAVPKPPPLPHAAMAPKPDTPAVKPASQAMTQPRLASRIPQIELPPRAAPLSDERVTQAIRRYRSDNNGSAVDLDALAR